MKTAGTELREAKVGRERWSWLLLLALAILLISALFPGHGVSRGNALRVMAQNSVTGMTAAVKAYYTEYGTMPTGSNAEIMRILRGDNPRKVIFFEADSKYFSFTGELLDPWKQPYRIDTSEPGKPWVYSCGPDKQDSGGAEGSDDVANWQ